ncbi:photosynthetic complex assembly protein PuhC [Methylobacterium sp. 77]|uniref:photosynthetic complex assembly protein PuhC n=1 Tax=Methylobacterium sp. 77 TaxID=1101192 RepID=UPI000374D53A|nr:photosynthetic complex assembly protein PuhC [Methylobacterium sp. 77]
MTAKADAARIPRPLIYGALGLMGFVTIVVGIGRSEGIGLSHMPPTRAVRSVDLSPEDRSDGAIVIRDAGSQGIIATVEPGEDNFVRATLRGFGQARLRAGLTRDQPFRLTRFADGGLELSDPSTGRVVNLGAFGPSNFAAFTKLLPDTRLADSGAAR